MSAALSELSLTTLLGTGRSVDALRRRGGVGGGVFDATCRSTRPSGAYTRSRQADSCCEEATCRVLVADVLNASINSPHCRVECKDGQ